MIKKYLPWVLLAAFVLIQFFQIDRTNPSYETTKDFFATNIVPDNMKTLITNSCYDCHSHQVTFPWYTYVNPVGWWVKGHVDEGVNKLNFSEWTNYTVQKQKQKLGECADKVEATEMPLLPYILAHSDARLSEEDRADLVAWFNQQAGN